MKMSSRSSYFHDFPFLKTIGTSLTKGRNHPQLSGTASKTETELGVERLMIFFFLSTDKTTFFC